MTFVRSASLILALAATPALSQELIITNPSIRVTPVASPLAAAPAPAPAAARAPAIDVPPPSLPASVMAPDPTADADIVPRGAPKDDYEFVGWCSGILAGHMELFGRVKPELDAISKRWNTFDEDQKDYAEQRAAGQKAQALFSRSMRAAEKAAPREITPVGQAAIASGVGMWKEINTVDKTSQAYSWLNWGLPARCERIASSLENRSNLLGAALKDNSAVAAPVVKPTAPSLPRGTVAPPAVRP